MQKSRLINRQNALVDIQKEYKILSVIGNGNFSKVYLGKHNASKQIVAIKVMLQHIQIGIKQCEILKRFSHPNIIHLHNYQFRQQRLLLYLQHMPQTILQLYQQSPYGLPPQQIKCILFQCVLGLKEIHSKGIIHRDIKPENIMINRQRAQVKIIDFGLSKGVHQVNTDYVATRWYRAPENLLNTKQYTSAIDIFSLGCVLMELFLGIPLFPGVNNLDQISKIISLLGLPTNTSWRKGHSQCVRLGLEFTKIQPKRTLKQMLSSCDQRFARIIEKMLIYNPEKRITADQILKDPYFYDIRKIVPSHVYEAYQRDYRSLLFNNQSSTQNKSYLKRFQSNNQRQRFLSQDKKFGAFTSLIVNPKKSLIQKNQILVFDHEDQKANITQQKNIDAKKPIEQIKIKQSTFQNSIKNIKNGIKNDRSVLSYEFHKSMHESTDSNNTKHLTFRGLNQPKQKFFQRQALNKNSQNIISSKQIKNPIKNIPQKVNKSSSQNEIIKNAAKWMQYIKKLKPIQTNESMTKQKQKSQASPLSKLSKHNIYLSKHIQNFGQRQKYLNYQAKDTKNNSLTKQYFIPQKKNTFSKIRQPINQYPNSYTNLVIPMNSSFNQINSPSKQKIYQPNPIQIGFNYTPNRNVNDYSVSSSLNRSYTSQDKYNFMYESNPKKKSESFSKVLNYSSNHPNEGQYNLLRNNQLMTRRSSQVFNQPCIVLNKQILSPSKDTLLKYNTTSNQTPYPITNNINPLSKLRQSITGLNPTLLSQRYQSPQKIKANNLSSININLNVNIYQKSNSKRKYQY